MKKTVFPFILTCCSVWSLCRWLLCCCRSTAGLPIIQPFTHVGSLCVPAVFVYRCACLPKLFMQRKYLRIALLLVVLAAVTELLTYFPMPAERITADTQLMAARMNMRRQTIWFSFW